MTVRSSWQSTRLSRYLIGLRDGTHGTFARVDHGIALLSAKNVAFGKLLIDVESQISAADAATITGNGYPRRGDVLLTIVGSVGRTAIYERAESLPFQRSVAFLRPDNRLSSRFLRYQLESRPLQDQIQLATKTSAQAGLYLGAVAALSVIVPPLHTQSAIADYLDRETAQIDALIREQQRLIELLGERRLAVVRAIQATPGLSVRLGHFARISSGDALPTVDFSTDDRSKGDVPVIGGNGIMGYTGRSNVASTVIAVGRVGALCGNAHRVDSPAWITDNALRIDLRGGFDINFLRRQLESLELNTLSRSTAQPLITGTQVSALRVTKPSLDEQAKRSRAVDRQVSRIDALITEAERFIELSKERRSALITAAVTGQIDVSEAA